MTRTRAATTALVGGVLAAGAIFAFRKLRARTTLAAAHLGEQLALPDLGVYLRHIRRYAFASSQDISPIVGLTHASYSLILLDALQEAAGAEAFAKAGVNVHAIRKFVTALQDTHAEKLKACDPHLAKILELERREGMQQPGFVVA